MTRIVKKESGYDYTSAIVANIERVYENHFRFRIAYPVVVDRVEFVDESQPENIPLLLEQMVFFLLVLGAENNE